LPIPDFGQHESPNQKRAKDSEHGRANFWLTRWLEGEIRSATNRIDRLGHE